MKQQLKNFSGPGGAHYQWSMFGARGPMREGENDPKGGGGGGDKKPKLDDDTKKEIVDLIHSTFTERDKRDGKKRQKEMTDAITAAVAAAMGKKSEEDPPEDPPADDPPAKKPAAKGGKKDDETNANLPPEIQALLKKQAKDIEDLKKRNQTAEEEKQAERRERLANEEIQALTEGLNGKVRGGTVKGLVTYLRGSRIVRDEEDPKRILWKGDKDGELLPLADGLKHWLSTDEGKEYIPATGAGGGGTGKPFSGRGPGSGEQGAATDAEVGSLISQRMR